MLKDTKSLGNNKAPACESRGFVLKKEGVLFDTPSYHSCQTINLLRDFRINMPCSRNKFSVLGHKRHLRYALGLSSVRFLSAL